MTVGAKVKSYFVNLTWTLLGGDYRSIALFRMAIALTILGDLIDRYWDLHAHYTDAGVMPRSIASQHFMHYCWISIHFLSGRYDIMLLIHMFHIFCALCMFFGYYTMTAAWLVWFLQNSLHSRNILVLHGGDVYVRIGLLWACFLPLGKCWSIDAAFKRKQKMDDAMITTPHRDLNLLWRGRTVTSGTYALAMTTLPQKDVESGVSNDGGVRTPAPMSYKFVNMGVNVVAGQIFLMYITSCHWKSGAEWTKTFDATWYALQLDYFRTPIGDMMLLLPRGVLQFLTYCVWRFENFCFLFFIFPIFPSVMRTMGVFGVILLHVGLAVALRLNTFFYIAVAVPMALYPSWFWDSIVYPFGRKLARPCVVPKDILYYNSDHYFAPYLAHLLYEWYGIPCLPLPDGKGAPALMMNSATSPSGTVTGIAALANACTHHIFLRPVGFVLRMIMNSSGIRGVLVLSAPFRSFMLSMYWLSLSTIDKWTPYASLSAVLPKESDDGARLRSKPSDSSDYSNSSGHGENGISPQPHANGFGPGKARIRGPSTQAQWTLFFGLWKKYMRKGRSIVNQLLGVYLFVLVLLYCMGGVGFPWLKPTGTNERVVFTMHLDQQWNMFSPRPPDYNWWYAMEAELVDGNHTEFFRNEGMFTWEESPVSYDRPAAMHRSVGNHRWIKWYESMNSNGKNEIVRLNFGRYVCREWNRRHPMEKRIYSFKIWYITSTNVLYGPRGPARKQTIWEHNCFDKRPELPVR